MQFSKLFERIPGRLSTQYLGQDALAAVVVTLMLIPQSLAYAMLAGLPPQAGLYASLLPLLGYAALGSSKTLAVGPVAIVSLMTAAALGGLGLPDMAAYASAAMVLALMSGCILLTMGLMRLGEVANFISHPVISGFLTASALLIGVGQARHILGIREKSDGFAAQVFTLFERLPEANMPTLAIGTATLVFLLGAKIYGAQTTVPGALQKKGWRQILPRFAPIVAVASSIGATAGFSLEAFGVAVVGDVPPVLPYLQLPRFSASLLSGLIVPAIAISLVGFVETVSVAQALAAKRRETISPDRELLGLGAANLAAGVSGGFPVTGGLSRSAVAYDAGARTRMAGVFTALGIGLAAAFLTPLLRALPVATLAATIIVAVISLVDVGAIRKAARYSKMDLAALLTTLFVTLGVGVAEGLVAGVGLSLALHVYRSSKPHMAVIGQIPGTEHFRNVDRHSVDVLSGVLSLRVDESLFFANARGLERAVFDLAASEPSVRCFILACPAINHIDLSALESLERINTGLESAGITLHLSEVKGPVMDRLERTDFLEHLSGKVFLTQLSAITHCRNHQTPESP